MKDFNLICAVSLNGIIGDSQTNTIPWHLPSDLQNFKRITIGKTIVMGSKTFMSLGRKLPNRKHVVITRGAGGHLSFAPGEATIDRLPDAMFMSFADVMRTQENGFFVIGGEHIFGEALRYLPKRLYITLIYHDAAGDVRFPISGHRFRNDHIVLDTTTYHEIERSPMQIENGLNFQFVIFERHQSEVRM